MGCGQSKAARAVAPLRASKVRERDVAGAVEVEAEPPLISSDSAPAESELDEAAATKRAEKKKAAQKAEEEGAVSAFGSGEGDDPARKTTAEEAPSAAGPLAVVVEGKAASGIDGSGGGSGAALLQHAPASVHPPAHRPTLPPAETPRRLCKPGNFASMVRTIDARLERSLEDVTGPIDPQQVHQSSLSSHRSPGITLDVPPAPDLGQVSCQGER